MPVSSAVRLRIEPPKLPMPANTPGKVMPDDAGAAVGAAVAATTAAAGAAVSAGVAAAGAAVAGADVAAAGAGVACDDAAADASPGLLMLTTARLSPEPPRTIGRLGTGSVPQIQPQSWPCVLTSVCALTAPDGCGPDAADGAAPAALAAPMTPPTAAAPLEAFLDPAAAAAASKAELAAPCLGSPGSPPCFSFRAWCPERQGNWSASPLGTDRRRRSGRMHASARPQRARCCCMAAQRAG